MKYVGKAVKEYELSQRRVKTIGVKTLAVKTLDVMALGVKTRKVKTIGVKTLGIATWSMIRMKDELLLAIAEKVTFQRIFFC